MPDQTVRRAFASAAGTGVAVEQELPAHRTADDLADAAVSAGIRGTLLTNRVRRIDNALTRLGSRLGAIPSRQVRHRPGT